MTIWGLELDHTCQIFNRETKNKQFGVICFSGCRFIEVTFEAYFFVEGPSTTIKFSILSFY
jgi:hypothetical protein